MRTLPLLALALFGGFTGCAGPSLPPFAGSYQHAAVAADHEVASRAGLEVLKKGGNAVDAAVAVSFTLSVVRPESCGIGGGGFMVIRFSEAGVADQRRLGRSVPRQVALNYREMAPWAVGPDFYEKEDRFASTHGGKAVGIPGTVAGLLTAHEKFGRLDRAAVLAPAIRAAEKGFVADESFVSAAKETAADFEKNPAWKERFRFVWERMLRKGKIKIGDVITNPEQASALRLIAEQGTAAFYQGPIAQAMIETVRRDGGVMTHDDLLRFRVASVEPLTFQAFGRTFLTMPPPSSGGVAMAEAMGILGLILEQPLRETQEKIEKNNPPRGFFEAIAAPGGMALPYGPMSPWYCHRLTEALKHAFADRAEWLGDPDFVDVPVARLVSKEYTGLLARRFQPERTLPLDQYGTRESRTLTSLSEDLGTSHLSVVDAAGNAVACTETINLGFGSCLAVDAFGFILNNQMDDFTTRRGQANAFGLKQSDRNLPAPGKRPLSSMTPTIVLGERGEVEVVAGASGGPRIITGTMQAILQRVGFGRAAWDAVQPPRLHHQWSPNVVRLERGFDAVDGATGVSLVGELQRFGHRVEPISGVGVVQMIARERGEWQAASDPRKGGKPAGY
ncbi:MAG: gamma-glutamyltransferase [Phycisphaeraceae bacterium]|nr:gamma-glutamyltransferase [Phycisphaeraceae bacterium]